MDYRYFITRENMQAFDSKPYKSVFGGFFGLNNLHSQSHKYLPTFSMKSLRCKHNAAIIFYHKHKCIEN